MSKGEETRAMILARALALTTEVGLEALSIGSLAREVGMSKSGLFAHFDSKENLQLAVLDLAAERFVEKVVAPALRAPRGVARLEAIFEHWLAWEDSPELPGGCPFVSLAVELEARPGAPRERLVAYQRDWIDTLATAAGIARREGQLRKDLDLRQFAHDFHSVLLSYHFFARLLRDDEAEHRARHAFGRLIAAARAT